MAGYFLLFDDFHRVAFLKQQVLCLNLSRVHIIRCRSIVSAVESRSKDFHTWNKICKCCSSCWTSTLPSIFESVAAHVGLQHCLRYLKVLQLMLDFNTAFDICECCSSCWISTLLSIFVSVATHVGFQHCFRYL